jgi:hypothetical protein
VAELVEPVEADHDDDEPVEAVDVDVEVVDVDVEAVDFDADDLVVPVAVVVVAAPVAMHAPSVAVARRLATPAATRERAAGRRRFWVGCIWSSLMPLRMRWCRQTRRKPS